MEHIFTIQDPQMNVDIALTPESGVFLGGLSQECELSFITTSNMTIPAQAPVRVVVRKEVSIQLHGIAIETVDTEEGTVEHHFTLPYVPADASHECHMTLTLPAVKFVHSELPNSPDQKEQMPVWQHVIDVFCDWMSPCYVASLPLAVYQPLTLTCLEHCAGQDNSFLQLLMKNTSPLPLLIKDPVLTTEVDLDQLHGNLPQVFFPLETFSFLWRAQPAAQVMKPRTPGTFGVDFSLLPLHFDWDEEELPPAPTFHSTQFRLSLSNMQTLFEVRTSVEALRDQVSMVVQQPATLMYRIQSVTELPPQETRFGNTSPPSETTPITAEYEVHVDKKAWSLKDKSQGVIDLPSFQEFVTIELHIVPNMSGPLPVPPLILKWPVGGVAQESCVLTPAQVYDVNRGKVMTIHTTTQGEQTAMESLRENKHSHGTTQGKHNSSS